ncbi:serine/threonine-protein kinase [Sphingomonas sp.]|uniref:serine/threonine protein kinase n=1 Tax=Sphingomonas sp. TaxID=28214 RepID=UPI001EC0E3DB|nr:serine/threonine-protein kinase [Sphingomonas sp.]MBX3595916.1 serine/threonine protein kinase [Sphingomonas sp.]
MPTIRLNDAEWTYDETAPLGPAGGFGEVFRGKGAAGPVAVKRLKLTASAAAHREMNIGQALSGRSLSHVVPVLDYGQDAGSDSYFLVMPICDRSLQDEIAAKGVLTLAEARTVALDVLAGLREVGDIVHRDLKPGNVLYFEGTWRLADFGIAKFVEDSTSLRTLRGSLTPAYGAPEQWNSEAPSRMTDVYALGCMFHTMLTGSPPFTGSRDEIREAHLHQPPPALGVDTLLSAFVGQMLRKTPAARPTIERCIEVIGSVETARTRPAHTGLLAAAGQVSREAAAAEAAAQAAATVERQRQQLVREATSELDAIIKRLFDEITEASEEARVAKDSIRLGRGTLVFGYATAVNRPAQRDAYGQAPAWEIAASATLSVTRAAIVRPARTPADVPIMYVGRATPDDRDYKWSATLFYGKSLEDPNYRWRETAFWRFARSRDGQDEPYALQPDDRDFQVAFSNTMGVASTAYGPLPIDGEDEDTFQHRWLTLFTKAVTGELNRPGQMPVPDHYLR